MEELTDAELVKKYLSGEQQALEILLQRYFKQVFFFAKTYVKQDQLVEDMTQEAFVKVWKNLKKFDTEKKFKTWVFQITKNTCIDYLRKHNKNLLAAESLDEEQMSSSLENITDGGPLPQELFDSQGFEENLEKIINQLTPNHRLAVSLHLQHDLTFQEIAEVLNESLNTVKSRYRRALLQIRQNINKDSG